METKTTSVPVPPLEDLVEVKKPTSLLIAQFFLFPLIIIAICIGIFLLFGYLTYEQKTAQEYLNDVRTGSELCCRWQSAYELSNIISSQRERLRNNDFVNDLVKVYQTSRTEDPRVRRYLALTMGHLGDPRAVPALLDGLNDNDIDNQIYNLWALGSIGDSAAGPDIAKKLDAKDPAIRRTAAYVLGALKDPRAIHDLKIALNDSSEDVRWNAAIALAQLNDASGSELLTKLLDRDYVNKLEGMTPEQKSQLVINAVKCLGLLKFQPAKDKIFVLSQSDPDLAVRDASLEALKKF
ncbi:MAG TPA: HEAT repeat domain-containing protein [Terriglobia bacterium]|nr:HEAT repeat domain-containing protein [Terriglobia bacterium]